MEEPELNFKLVDFWVLSVVKLLEGLGFGALKLELGISQVFEFSRR
jgi:hypothetical protein